MNLRKILRCLSSLCLLSACSEPRIELRGRSLVHADLTSVDFGYRYVGSTITTVITLTNIKPSTAIALSPAALVAPFSFLGGSFPGTGGTCAIGLQGLTSCSIVVAYDPTAVATDATSLVVDFSDRFSSGSLTVNLTGIAVVPGLSDVTFPTAGITTFGGAGQDQIPSTMALQGTSLFIAGYSNNGVKDSFSLSKTDLTGTVDTSFGSAGFVTLDLGAGQDRAAAMAIDTSGNFFLAGHTFNGIDFDMGLVKTLPTGQLDPSFNLSGQLTLDLGGAEDRATGVALLPDGRLIVAGYSNNGVQDSFAAARITPLGVLDLTWNTVGYTTTALGGTQDRAHAMVLQTDGMVVLGGFSNNGATDDFALVRYDTTGILDAGFNGAGIVTTVVGVANSRIQALALQPDGSIVAAGYANNGADNDFAIARYTPAGILDPAFNGGAPLLVPIGGVDDVAQTVAIDGSGNILVGGYSFNGVTNDSALIRLTSAGALDTSFGAGGTGIQTTAVGGLESRIQALVFPIAGKTLAIGQAYNGTDWDLVLQRYWN